MLGRSFLAAPGRSRWPRVAELAEGRAPWAIPWPCLHEFPAIVTHPRIHAPPSPLAAATDQVDAWLASPSLTLLAEAEGCWQELQSMMRDGRIADRDFSRFHGVALPNPMVR